KEWISFLSERAENKPFFGFLFYDAPHQYAFPPDEKLKFLPSWERIDYMDLHPQFDPLPFKNRYKNSVHFVDRLVGEVLTDLRNRGLDKNTVIVLTGDHGQEFNDSGQNYWGHNSNFSIAQTHVPLVIYWP